MNILLLRHSAGFEHSYLPDAEVALKAIGKENGLAGFNHAPIGPHLR